MKKLILAALVFGFISACSTVEHFSEMSKQTDAVATELEAIFGVRPQIGWHMNNGSLTETTVIFLQAPDGEVTIKELSESASKSIFKHFEKKPKNLFVSFAAERIN